MPHVCHADGCETPVQPKFLFCAKHWTMLPKRHKMEIWRTYKKGQEITKTPTPEYMEAQRAAIQAVKQIEERLRSVNAGPE